MGGGGDGGGEEVRGGVEWWSGWAAASGLPRALVLKEAWSQCRRSPLKGPYQGKPTFPGFLVLIRQCDVACKHCLFFKTYCSLPSPQKHAETKLQKQPTSDYLLSQKTMYLHASIYKSCFNTLLFE